MTSMVSKVDYDDKSAVNFIHSDYVVLLTHGFRFPIFLFAFIINNCTTTLQHDYIRYAWNWNSNLEENCSMQGTFPQASSHSAVVSAEIKAKPDSESSGKTWQLHSGPSSLAVHWHCSQQSQYVTLTIKCQWIHFSVSLWN